jgi:hypothetical protein
MKPFNRSIKSKQDANQMILWLQNATQFPFTITIKEGSEKRSNQQNRLAFQWMNDAESQGDQTASEYRAYCKLHFGVPILRADDEYFRERYDSTLRPLDYETKLGLMLEPFDFSVTRLMNTKQHARYLDQIYRHFTGLGMLLTEPSLMGISKWREVA